MFTTLKAIPRTGEYRRRQVSTADGRGLNKSYFKAFPHLITRVSETLAARSRFARARVNENRRQEEKRERPRNGNVGGSVGEAERASFLPPVA